MSLGRRLAALFLAILIATLPARRGAAQDGADTVAPVIGFQPCETFQKDRPFSVLARFADESALFEPKLVYHAAGDKVWKHVKFVPEGELWRAVIPKAELSGALEYFVEVFDENGNGPSRLGSPEAPLFARAVRRAPECPAPESIVGPVVVEEHGTASPTPVLQAQAKPRLLLERCEPGDPAPPFYCKRWVWLAAGGAVLATVGIILIATSGGGRDYPDRVDFEIRAQGLERD